MIPDATQTPSGWEVKPISKVPLYAENGTLTPEAIAALAGSGVGRTSLSEIVSRYNGARRANPRVLPTIPLAAVGVAPTAGQLGWTNATTTGPAVAVAGYNVYALTANLTNGAPVTQGAFPFALSGGMPYKVSDQLAVIGGYQADGTSAAAAAGRIVIPVEGADNLIFTAFGGGTHNFYFNIDLGQGFQRVASPVSSALAGYVDVTLDFSQLGNVRAIEILQSGLDNQKLMSVKLQKKVPGRVATKPYGPQILVVCDSLGMTVKNGVGGMDAWPMVAQDYTGCEFWVWSEGSTGYTADPAPGVKTTAISRVPLIAATTPIKNPAAVVLAFGVNDTDSAGYQAVVSSTIAAYAAAFPKALLIVLGSFAANDTNSQAQAVIKETKIAAAVAASSLPASRIRFVPIMTAATPLIGGTGNTSALAANGVADLIFDSGDNTHWNVYGHSKYFGPLLAHQIVQAVLDSAAG